MVELVFSLEALAKAEALEITESVSAIWLKVVLRRGLNPRRPLLPEFHSYMNARESTQNTSEMPEATETNGKNRKTKVLLRRKTGKTGTLQALQ
jgi:hypothetical protein